MKPEHLVSKAIARRGRISQAEVMDLAAYASSLRALAHSALAAYFAAETFASCESPRELAREALDEADRAIEAWAEVTYGANWRELEPDVLASVNIPANNPSAIAALQLEIA